MKSVLNIRFSEADNDYDYTYEIDNVFTSCLKDKTIIHRAKMLITDNSSGLKYNGYFRFYDNSEKSCQYNLLGYDDLADENKLALENAFFVTESSVYMIEDFLLEYVNDKNREKEVEVER